MNEIIVQMNITTHSVTVAMVRKRWSIYALYPVNTSYAKRYKNGVTGITSFAPRQKANRSRFAQELHVRRRSY